MLHQCDQRRRCEEASRAKVSVARAAPGAALKAESINSISAERQAGSHDDAERTGFERTAREYSPAAA